MPRTDEELMLDFAGGDPAGFDALLERYRDRVFGFIVNLLRDRTFAEDVFQEVFVKIIGAAGTFDASRKFAPWLFRIVDNACMDAFRCAGRNTPVDESGPVVNTAPHAANPEATLLKKERHAELAEAITLLPQPQRQVIALHEFAGLSFAETAEAMDRPLNTVLSDMRRALQGLKKHFEVKE